MIMKSSLLTLCLMSMLACGGSSRLRAWAPPIRRPQRARPRVESIPQVDLADLTDAEKSLWVDMVNDQLSPCGDPVSVAKCANEQTASVVLASLPRATSRGS